MYIDVVFRNRSYRNCSIVIVDLYYIYPQDVIKKNKKMCATQKIIHSYKFIEFIITFTFSFYFRLCFKN